LKGIKGSTIEVKEEEEFLGYGKVYYHQQVTANILSFFNLSKRFTAVTFNRNEDTFVVTKDDGSIMQFTPSNEGLYYYIFALSIQRRKEMMQAAMLVEIVENIKRNYTKREIEGADQARRLFVIGRPSDNSFELMMKKGKILSHPVTVMDFRDAKLGSWYGQRKNHKNKSITYSSRITRSGDPETIHHFIC
jgi:hypothetical protein